MRKRVGLMGERLKAWGKHQDMSRNRGEMNDKRDTTTEYTLKEE